MQNKFFTIFITGFLILMYSMGYSQSENRDSTISQPINFDLEKDDIFKFLNEIGKITDSLEIQKYICFPFFFTELPFGCLTRDYPRDYYNDITDKSDSINKLYTCITPLTPISKYYRRNKNFRDSLKQKAQTLFDYYFQNDLNKQKYCGWFLRQNKFPIMFDEDAINSIKIANSTMTNGRLSIDTKVITIRCYTLYKKLKKEYSPLIFVIYKIKNQYKIYGLSYIYN